jgi:hypothetical protein
MFVDTLLNKAARSGEALTAEQLIDRSEKLLERRTGRTSPATGRRCSP